MFIFAHSTFFYFVYVRQKCRILLKDGMIGIGSSCLHELDQKKGEAIMTAIPQVTAYQDKGTQLT